MAFPVGPTQGQPIFRFTFEVNRLRSGFFTRDVLRSRRYNLGAEHFPDYVDVAPTGPGQIRAYEELGYLLIEL